MSLPIISKASTKVVPGVEVVLYWRVTSSCSSAAGAEESAAGAAGAEEDGAEEPEEQPVASIAAVRRSAIAQRLTE